MKTETRYCGPGWYAPAQYGNSVVYSFVAELEALGSEASRMARLMGLGTPRKVTGRPDDTC